ncbi:MAG: YicC family protein [Verrucomicrobiae bacterium]|nr:YicC family protein [Verrucomicrobiae bacterium]MCP5539289.1 YicC family protein [Akkermansiaceae bacterium]
MRSMTGFGRGEAAAGNWRLTAELSSVNRKQIDLAINLPGRLAEFEGDVRKRIAESVSRGRVNVRVTLENLDTGESRLIFDEALARQYVDAARRLTEATGADTRIAAADLFRAPGVFRIEETALEPEELRGALAGAIDEALKALKGMQETEGSHLAADIRARLEAIAAEVASIREAAPAVGETYRRNLRQRLEEAGIPVDLGDDRLLREIALFADRCDISEEITRIDSHLKQFHRYLDSAEPAGRPLDFLCQELNREFNTIGSKANDADVAQSIVRNKTELEKIREQVQNIQ